MEDLTVPADLADVDFVNDKGYKQMEVSNISDAVLQRVQDLQELYEMDEDALIIIARHYKWNPEAM